MFAVHNYHSPAIEIDEAGHASLDGRHHFPLPEPLHTAATFEEAEQWRLSNQPDFYSVSKYATRTDR
jgi:hypothetical protein